MATRFFIDTPLSAGQTLDLPPSASRHVQVLRLQPGDLVTLFDGSGGQWQAALTDIGRRHVSARLVAHEALERELATPVTLALGMPANERMDTVIEKAAELGVARIQPLVCERSVLRVAGERAERKAAHWQAVAAAACEQCGRNRVPEVAAPLPLRDWLAGGLDDGALRLMLAAPGSASDDGPAVPPLAARLPLPAGAPVVFLSGPEGGLSPAEQQAALARGFAPVSLGRRVLRADTAPLAALACVAAFDPAG